MATEDCGLTKVPRTKRQHRYNQEWSFGEGNVREAFQKIFSPKRDYVLFQTVVNPEAVDILKQYVGYREEMDSPWQIRKILAEDNPRYVPGATNQGNGLKFDNNLMDSYKEVIRKIANKNVGIKNYSSYPLVYTSGVHNLDRDKKAIFWPTNYIVTDEKEEKLKSIIDNLSSDESLEILREHESPQFYKMGHIETLHKLEIAPLIRLEREWRIGAQELAMCIDFLVQMRETYRWSGPVINIDA